MNLSESQTIELKQTWRDEGAIRNKKMDIVQFAKPCRFTLLNIIANLFFKAEIEKLGRSIKNQSAIKPHLNICINHRDYRCVEF